MSELYNKKSSLSSAKLMFLSYGNVNILMNNGFYHMMSHLRVI